MLVEFYDRPIEEGTTEDGLPKYVNVVYVKITRDATHTVDREMKEEDKERYERAWTRYEKGHEAPEINGFPLAMWPECTPADRMNLANLDVYTVQQFAELSPKIMGKLPAPVHQLQRRAKQFIEFAGAANLATSNLKQMTEENDALKEQIQELKQTVAARDELISKLQSKEPA